MTFSPVKETIVGYIAVGLSSREIGHRLNRSHRTVEKHIQEIADQIDTDRAIPPMRRIMRWALRRSTT